MFLFIPNTTCDVFARRTTDPATDNTDPDFTGRQCQQLRPYVVMNEYQASFPPSAPEPILIYRFFISAPGMPNGFLPPDTLTGQADYIGIKDKFGRIFKVVGVNEVWDSTGSLLCYYVVCRESGIRGARGLG